MAPERRPSTLVNPFEGVPWTDYLRDGAAALLLFMTLGSDWDLADTKGGDHWWIIIAVLLSLGSLAVPYLLAAKAVPNLSAHESQLIKLALNVPLLASVLTVFIVSAANFDDTSAGYVGPAVAFALAASVLAVQPRKVEDGPTTALWLRGPMVLGAAALGGTLAADVYWLLNELISADLDIDFVLDLAAIVCAGPLVVLLLFGRPLLGLARNTFVWNRLFVVLGTSYLGAMAVTLLGDPRGFLYAQCPEKLVPASAYDGSVFPTYCGDQFPASLFANYPLGAFLSLLPAAAVLALSRPVLSRVPATDRVSDWISTASKALILFALVASAYIVLLTLLLVVIARSNEVWASVIVRVVVLLVAVVLALVTRALFGSPARNRLTIVLLAAILMVLALVNAIVGHESDHTQYSSLGLVFGFALPALVIYAFAGPSAVRTAFGNLLPAPESPEPSPEASAQPGDELSPG
jgi:hypothetical protein